MFSATGGDGGIRTIPKMNSIKKKKKDFLELPVQSLLIVGLQFIKDESSGKLIKPSLQYFEFLTVQITVVVCSCLALNLLNH